MIYLDNNATTAVDAGVLKAMMPYLTERYGNPSSMHRFGQEARQAVEHARRQVARMLGCDVREVLFTSGGTEADNAAIYGVVAKSAKKVILTSSVEHSAVREPLAGLAKGGYEVIEIGVDALGNLRMEELETVLVKRAREVALASFMWANNETGVIFDATAIGEMCRRHGVVLHVDGVQAAGKLGMVLKDMPVDLMSVSAHKFHGAKGTGALFVRRGVAWQPWVKGGPQERDRRGGTENVAGIVGMGAAAEMMAISSWEGVAKLRDRFEREVLERIPDSHVNGDVGKRLGNTSNIGFAGLEAEAILLLLSENDICASAGAACSSGSLEPSHVLKAMKLAERVAHGSIRFSLSGRTTEEEIAETLEILPGVIERLRATLPV